MRNHRYYKRMKMSIFLLLLSNALPSLLPVKATDDGLEPLYTTRDQRFPSREERVKLYMSNWYIPPCEQYTEGTFSYTFHKNETEESWPKLYISMPPDFQNQTTQVLDSIITPDDAFYMDIGTIKDCAREKGSKKYENRIKFRGNMIMYCTDALDSIQTALEHINWEEEAAETRSDTPPTLLQFGDLKYSHSHRYVDFPLIKKFRSSTTRQQLERVTEGRDCYGKRRPVLENAHDIPHMQPIIWKLATHRHFRLLALVQQDDTPWESKKDMAVFRGQLTGGRGDGYDPNHTDEENCLKMRRCRLVYKHANSKLIDARLTSMRGKVPKEVNGVQLHASSVNIGELLKYKGIIMMEGNDVASGLKWALLSQSVVLMPPPKHTSWAMEELLVPWVHYIPLDEDLSDIEEKMQWVLDNDEKARHIAERGALWMEDLCFHPDAKGDDRWIQEEIIRRYRMHFQADQAQFVEAA